MRRQEGEFTYSFTYPPIHVFTYSRIHIFTNSPVRGRQSREPVKGWWTRGRGWYLDQCLVQYIIQVLDILIYHNLNKEENNFRYTKSK